MFSIEPGEGFLSRGDSGFLRRDLCTQEVPALFSVVFAGGGDVPLNFALNVTLLAVSQAIAFAVGGVLGTGASDLARWLLADAGLAYACVFAAEAALFLAAAWLAAHLDLTAHSGRPQPSPRAAFGGSALAPGADIQRAR